MKPLVPSQVVRSNHSETFDNGSPDDESDQRIDILVQSSEYEGNRIEEKRNEHFRIGVININGIPKNSAHPKNINLQETINNYSFDVIGLTETNCYWPMLEDKHKWSERVKQWWDKSKTITAYHKHPVTPVLHQPGGVMNIALNSTTNTVIKSGSDTIMGRWTWMTLRGKHDIKTTVITVYRPCKNNKGSNTVYSQQLRHLAAQQIDVCPRQLWLDDLKQLINSLQDKGHQIILMGDFNENVQSRNMVNWANSHGLIESVSISSDHSIPTHNSGSKPIDGIFISPSLTRVYSGYLPFGTFQSDHRALWIDLTQSSVYGFSIPTTIQPNIRRLQCNIPHVRNKWIQLYTQFLKQHKVIQRQFKLEASLSDGPLDQNQVQEFEKILKLRTEGFNYAEKRCRKIYCGQVPFSPTVQKAKLEIELWKAASTIISGRQYSSTKFRRLEKKVGLFNLLQKTRQELQSGESKAFSVYWKSKKSADRLRQSFILQKAESIAEDSNEDTDNVLKRLLKNEQSRKDNRQIKVVLKKLNNTAVTTVEVTQEDGSTIELTDRLDIEHACIVENMKKYSQTENTICMQEPLRTLLGKTGTSTLCSNILDGTAQFPTNTPRYTKEFFHQLAMNPEAQNHPFHTRLTSEDFRDGWKKMKESTSAASKTGLHFGHLKASASNTILSEFESSISHVPFWTGYVPEQWKEGIIIMIKKKIGLNTVQSLRSVVLTEADFNFNNKILGRRAIQHAEDINDIAQEQYGSRKGKSSIDQALNKRLTYDIMRQTKFPGILCSNDAKSCYDRVLHSIASLAYQRIGIPKPPVQCMLKCIQEMKHQIRTNFGISEETLQKRYTMIPLQGILQGNGASPTTWVLISTPLLNMLRTHGNGAKFKAPISKELSHIVGFAFVDDTDLITFDMQSDNRDWDDITTQMQQAIDRWEGGLKTTGGAIVPTKSWIYPIKFIFDNKGKASYQTCHNINHEFSVINEHGDRVPLISLDAHVGKETLGVILAPDGNNKDALKSLLQKAKSWSANIRTGHLKPSLAWQAAQTTIMKTLEYPLPALTLQYKECHQVMSIVRKGLLNSSRISVSMPNEVIFGPKEDGGFQLHHLYTSQGIFHIEKLMKFLPSNTLTGKLQRVSLQLCILEIGIGRNIFQLPYRQFECLLSDSWIKHVWEFAYENEITIVDRVSEFPLPSRQGDVFLMEAFSEQGYSRKQMQILNRCRIYLQALTLSDVMNGKGDGFTQTIRGERDPQKRNDFRWPYQPAPSTQMIKFWKKALRKTFGMSAGITTHKLGMWLHNDTSQWIWFYHPGSQSIMQRFGNVWRMWKRESNRGRLGPTSKFKYFTTRTRIPVSSQKATIQHYSDSRILLTGWSQSLEDNRISYSLELTTDSLHLDSFHTEAQANSLVPHLLQGNVNIVCDGSYHPKLKIGAAAWVIESTNEEIRIQGSKGVTGPSQAQSACRSELFGIFYSLAHLFHLIKDVTDDITFHIYCDGLSAIQSIQNFNKSNFCTKQNFDILNSIKVLSSKIPFKYQLHHVKGHQDQGTAYAQLSKHAQLNVIADDNAKQQLNEIQLHGNQYQSSSIALSPIDIFIKDNSGHSTQICTNLIESLRSSLTTDASRKYWIDKKNLHLSYNQIDWNLRAHSLRNIPTHEHRWLCKYTTGFCGVGSMLLKYRYQTHTKCPRCGADNERTDHVLQCKGAETSTIWKDEIKKLQEWMISQDLYPELVTLIITELNNWRDNHTSTYTPTNQHLQQALTSQRRIGWFHFIEGFWANSFVLCQQAFFDANNSPKSSTLLLSKTQRRIWKVAWSLWSHRNQYLHDTNNSFHPQEIQNIDHEITYERNKGLDTLSTSYSTLFSEPLIVLLAKTHIQKLNWLTTVWTVRELNDNAYFLETQTSFDPLTRYRYLRWKQQL